MAVFNRIGLGEHFTVVSTIITKIANTLRCVMAGGSLVFQWGDVLHALRYWGDNSVVLERTLDLFCELTWTCVDIEHA